MKTMKLVMMLLIVTLSVSFTGCSDDEKDSKRSDLIGAWRSMDSDGGYTMYVFYSNGNGIFTEESDDTSDSDMFTYQLMDNMIMIRESDGDIVMLQIVSLSKTMLVVMDDGEYRTFIKSGTNS